MDENAQNFKFDLGFVIYVQFQVLTYKSDFGYRQPNKSSIMSHSGMTHAFERKSVIWRETHVNVGKLKNSSSIFIISHLNFDG